jgi:N-acetylglucosaminyl-diphospho-decaprenol L-rhamnosyltransferase
MPDDGTGDVVDVAVVTWNTRELTVAALRRLLDTDQGCRVRLLVHDNGSTDGTPEALRQEVPEAALEAGSENLGFAGGVNRLIARSRSPWVCLLNSDAWPEPGALGTLLATGRDRPRAAAIAPCLLRPSGEIEHSTHSFPSVEVAALTALGLYRRVGRRRAERLLLPGVWDHDRALAVPWAVGAALLMRREALDEVGPFDERFFMYAEDLDWCWRAADGGWEVWFEPDAVVRHVGDASGRQNYGADRPRAYMRNTYRVFRARHGRVVTGTYRALNAIGSMRLALLHLLRGDRARAAFWARQLPVHLTSGTGPDGPPESP